MSKFRLASPLRRAATLIGAALLLAFVGAVATRGPARRDVQSPVYLSRASGQAEPAGGAVLQRIGDIGISGPFTVSAAAVSFEGDVRHLPKSRSVVKDVRPEPQAGESDKATHAALGDNAIQAPARPAFPNPIMPLPLQNFAGLSFSGLCSGGQCGAGFPPDTNGDVGPNHYVQVVNTAIGIFDKTGNQLAAFSFDSLFSGTLTPCDDSNQGDPVALYDAQADRWIISDFAWSSFNAGPFYECIAASTSGDPTGNWRFYALPTNLISAPKLLSDYPKLGVWPDGIYMSANMFDCSTGCTSPDSYKGVRVWAINRDDLFSGNSLRASFFDLGSSYFSLLPSNFRGAVPPAGTPNYFVSNDQSFTNLDVFKFHVDWTHPLSSTFTGPTQVPEAPYNPPPATVPAHNGNALDTLGDRLMMQNQYRTITGTESLWIAHTADDPTGIRWYQLDVLSGTVATTPVQQSTFKPDPSNRWMPSLAVDKFGDMAVGYSTSNAGQFPDIRYAGRLVGDTPNTLGQDENVLISGGGAQTNNCGSGACVRWGDYSAMTVDPVDDCTFWYTTEYYAASGQDWQTRIGSFRFPACGPVPPPLTPRIFLPAVMSNGTWTTIMQEGFEGPWPGAGWQISDSGNPGYVWARSSCVASGGSFSAWAIGGGPSGQGLFCGSNYTENLNSWMVYGPFSLAGATAAELDAQLWVNSEPGFDFACLMASVDGNHFYTSSAGTCFSGSTGAVFEPKVLDLNDIYTQGSFLGQPNVWVAVIFQSDFSVNLPGGAYVDNLLLGMCTIGNCSSPGASAAGGQLQHRTAAAIRP